MRAIIQSIAYFVFAFVAFIAMIIYGATGGLPFLVVVGVIGAPLALYVAAKGVRVLIASRRSH